VLILGFSFPLSPYPLALYGYGCEWTRCSSAFAFDPCTTSTARPSLPRHPSLCFLPFPSVSFLIAPSFYLPFASFSLLSPAVVANFPSQEKSVDINNNNNEQGEPWRLLLSPLPSFLLVALLPLSRPPLALLLLLVLLLVLRYST
jgi:hypothetical protein